MDPWIVMLRKVQSWRSGRQILRERVRTMTSNYRLEQIL